MIDLIAHNHGGKVDPEIRCLDHGFVRLVDVMPRISYDPEITTCDFAAVQAARTSYGDGTKQVNEDKGLIRYLMRHRHTTPSEMIEFKFHQCMPIFVARQWIRHRTANVNEMSGRYSILPNKFYHPEEENVRAQSTKNKQVSEGSVEEVTATEFLAYIDKSTSELYEKYEHFLDKGIGKEQARMILPLNLYTEWYWKCDLHNILHFLALRCDAHAQQEIRVFANAMLDLIKPLVPWAIQAWEDYHPMRGAMLLTRLEVEALQKATITGLPEINTENKREKEEWLAKLKKIIPSQE